MRRYNKRYWLILSALLGCFSVWAVEVVSLPQLVRASDAVVVGKLEVTREDGMTITWYPEKRGQEKQTQHYDIGRIRVSNELRKRTGMPYGEGYYPVAFISSSFTNEMRGIWFLRWNGLVGRYEFSRSFDDSVDDVEKAIAEVGRDDTK
jgi:hypothetical protein